MSAQVSLLVRAPLFWIFLCFASAAVVSNLVAKGARTSTASNAKVADKDHKLKREGTKLEKQVVTCRASGDKLMIEVADMPGMQALQNLAAERILRAIVEDSQDNRWTVSGEITEFQGRNYLFLKHVTRSSQRLQIPSQPR